jgi:RNA polymerase sigma factor (sigma-70 family)
LTPEEIISKLLGVRADQELALRHLYLGLGKEFFHYFAANSVPAQNAHDLVQETILKILERASQYSGEGSANAWMWQIARNALVDHARSPYFRKAEFFADEPERLRAGLRENSGMDFVMVDCISKGLLKFHEADPEHSYALELYALGYDGLEIAERLNKTPTASRQYLTQSRKKVMPYIDHCVEESR